MGLRSQLDPVYSSPALPPGGSLWSVVVGPDAAHEGVARLYFGVPFIPGGGSL